ncbi:MAG: hypothetical protein Q9173_003091 [Seirophora scorigena]
MSESQEDPSSPDSVSDKRSEATSKEKPRWSPPENSGSQPAPANARETSLPLLPARESVPKQRQNLRSSAPPYFDMDIDEPGHESQQQLQARPQPHSGAQGEEQFAREARKPVERVEVDGHPGAERDDQPVTQQSDGAHSTQPNGTEHDEANGASGQQVPPSGQEIVAAEETVIDPKVPLEPYGWDELEQRFLKKMDECQIREGEIEKEFREWINRPLRKYYSILTFGPFCFADIFISSLAATTMEDGDGGGIGAPVIAAVDDDDDGMPGVSSEEDRGAHHRLRCGIM